VGGVERDGGRVVIDLGRGARQGGVARDDWRRQRRKKGAIFQRLEGETDRVGPAGLLSPPGRPGPSKPSSARQAVEGMKPHGRLPSARQMVRRARRSGRAPLPFPKKVVRHQRSRSCIPEPFRLPSGRLAPREPPYKTLRNGISFSRRVNSPLPVL